MIFCKEYLSFLRCPKTGGELVYEPGEDRLVSIKGGISYPIREGIPILLEEEGEKLS